MRETERYPVPAGYEKVAQIGAGGMARVFECICQRSNKRVAMKVSSPQLGDEGCRLALREAWIASRTVHPNIARVHAYGRLGPSVWMQMDLVRGTPLATLLKHGMLTVRRRIEILRDVARVLGDVHDLGVVHQDVKAQNIMIRDDGSVCLIDFGIAKLESEANANDAVMGTPSRMPPERLLGKPSDRRADVFQLGALVYDLVATRGPWDKLQDPLETALKICAEAPVDLLSVLQPCSGDDLRIVHAIAPLVQLMLAHDPSLRPHDARELAREIDAAPPTRIGGLSELIDIDAPVWVDPCEIDPNYRSLEAVCTAA